MRCLLLTFDCLPRRWLGCYGSLDSTTRGFDRLAALGTTFENAISGDVRTQPGDIAGFSVGGTGEHPLLRVSGAGLALNSFVVTAASDGPSHAGKKRKRSQPRLAQKLHQACDWMREQSGQSLAWVRHAGLLLPDSPTTNADDIEGVLAQLAAIDEEFDAFLDEWLDCADERWTLVITSGRGVRRPRTSIRRRDAADSSPRISDDLVRVPLLVLESRGEGFGRRHLPLVATSHLAEVVREAAAGNDHRLINRLRGARPPEAVRIEGDEGTALRTAEWLWVPSTSADREAGEGELFRKPEDVCDVFDVRSTHADVALRLDEPTAA